MNRLNKLRNKFKADYDAMIVTDQKNIRYLCGFDYTDGCLLITKERALLFCDFRYIEAAKKNAHPFFEIIMFSGKRSKWLADALKDNEVAVLGYEDRHLTVSEYHRLSEDLPCVQLKGIGAVISELREYKDLSEFDNIIRAQRIAEKAFEHILDFITPERTERETALELEFEMRRLGADGISFETIAVSGTASSMPHGVPRDRKLEKGFLTMDFGAIYNGYCSDMTRTVCIGRANEEMKRVYNTVLEAQKRAIEGIKHGIICRDADALARDHINDMGYKGCFGHSLGHGVGMDIHEAPNLSPYALEKKLDTGHVVTCEPGIYLEGKYGVRIEDMLIFYPGTVVNITKSSKDLIEIY
ncbi:MAG: aminopeptidase P family protein [Ruminococcaceae bacterium]|nr:aminopeptidase P family protein [Oscillospiraceae bacterium]